MLNKRQLKLIFNHLSEEKRVPLKFAYLDNGALNWSNLMKGSDKLSVGAKNLEIATFEKVKKRLKRILYGTQKIDVYDLGCGDGDATLPIIDFLKKAGFGINYTALDFSLDLMNEAQKKIATKNILRVSHLFIDFDADFPRFLKKKKPIRVCPRLYLLIGNTLSNFPSPETLLNKCLRLLEDGDLLIVGVELHAEHKHDEMLEYYGNKYAKNFVYYIPSMFGITDKNSTLRVIWDKDNLRVRLFLETLKNIEIHHDDKEYLFIKGTRLHVADSIKFNLNTLYSFIDSTHYTFEKYQYKNYTLLMLRKN